MGCKTNQTKDKKQDAAHHMGVFFALLVAYTTVHPKTIGKKPKGLLRLKKKTLKIR